VPDSWTAVGVLAMIFSITRFAHAEDIPPVPCAVAPPPEGQVIVTGASAVVVTGSGWKRGDGVEFVRTREGASEGEPSKPERIATGRVLSVMPGRARVSVGLDTRIPVGTPALRAARAHSDYPLAPARLPGVVHAGFDVRTFLPLDEPAGVGMLGSAFGMYRFDPPVAVRFNAVSLGFVTSPPGGAVFDGNIALTFDTQFFEVGLGAGAVASHQVLFLSAHGSKVPIAFDVVHFVRVGAIDGLKAEAQVAEYLPSAEPAHVHGLIQVPITRQWWLLARGGGGQPRYLYAEQGARLLLKGNGDRHSLFLNLAFGYSAVGATRSTYPYQSSIGGPSYSVGLEWRL
jgi:hypothetical protein